MIQALVLHSTQSKNIVYRIIEKTSNTSAADTSSFSFQVQNLTDHASLPKQPAVEPCTVLLQRFLEADNHAQAEGPIRGDCLATTHLTRELTAIPRLEETER